MSSSPIPTTSGPFPLTEAQEAEAQRHLVEWEDLVEADLDQNARRRAEEIIAQVQVGVGDAGHQLNFGGYLGDTARPGGDLLLLARACATGDAKARAEAQMYLKRGIDHQVAYINRLEEAIGAPRKRSSFEVWKPAGVKSTDTHYQKRALSKADSTLAQMREVMDVWDTHGIKTAAEAERNADRKSFAQKHADTEFGQLLIEGDHAVAHRFAALVAAEAGFANVVKQLKRDDIAELMANAARVQRAIAAASIGASARPLTEIGRFNDRLMQKLLVVRMGGDAAERIFSEHRRGTSSSDEITIPRADSVEQIFAVARAMHRNTKRFVTSTESLQHGATLRIPASIGALRELRDAKAGTGVWDQVVISDRPATFAGGKRSIWVEAHMKVRVGEQQVRMIAEAHLGETMFRNDDRVAGWIHTRAHEHGAADLIRDARRVEEHQMPPGSGRASVMPHKPSRDGRTRRGTDTITDLIGNDRCRHENAEWVAANGRSHIHDSVRLECRDCLRARVAVAPLHQLPADHPVRRKVIDGTRQFRGEEGAPELSNEQRYLMRERYYAALRDDDRPIVGMQQLTRRDGTIELDPTHYATGEGAATSKRRQVRSIADAMRRRGR